MKIQIPINGMHCASCAKIIERALKKSEGIEEASVNYATEKATVSFDEKKTNIENINKKIKDSGHAFYLQG
jgi:Cu+-exporting ATPase